MRGTERRRMIDHAGRKVVILLTFDNCNLSIFITIFNNRIFSVLRQFKNAIFREPGRPKCEKIVVQLELKTFAKLAMYQILKY